MNKLIFLLPFATAILFGCQHQETLDDFLYKQETIWECDSRKDYSCLENIYHFGYKRNGELYVWRNGDLMPSVVCSPERGCVDR